MKKTRKEEIYEEFEIFCEENGLTTNNFNNFCKYVSAVGYEKYGIMNENQAKKLFDAYLKKTKQTEVTSTYRRNSDQPSTSLVRAKFDQKILRRKRHLRRDWAIKKLFVPSTAALTGTVITFLAITAANIVAGTGVLIPVTANATMNFLSTLSLGAAGGIILTPTIILAKNAITKAYYKSKYGNVEKILKKYEKAQAKQLKKDLAKANTPEEKAAIRANYPMSNKYNYLRAELERKLSPLQAKVLESTKKVNALKEGKKWTAPFRALARTAINISNRNRIHHIMKCEADLQKEIGTMMKTDNNMLVRKTCATILNKSRESINNFMKEDIAASLKYIDSHPRKTHLIENADIYANNILNTLIAQGVEKKPTSAKAKKERIDDLVEDIMKGKIDLFGRPTEYRDPDAIEGSNNSPVSDQEEDNSNKKGTAPVAPVTPVAPVEPAKPVAPVAPATTSNNETANTHKKPVSAAPVANNSDNTIKNPDGVPGQMSFGDPDLETFTGSKPAGSVDPVVANNSEGSLIEKMIKAYNVSIKRQKTQLKTTVSFGRGKDKITTTRVIKYKDLIGISSTADPNVSIKDFNDALSLATAEAIISAMNEISAV